MRKLLIAPVMALSIFLVVGSTTGLAGTSPLVTSTNPAASGLLSLDPNKGADIYAVGAGTTNAPFTEHFDMSAHTGPQGDFGQVGVTETDATGAQILSYKVDVTCVHVHTGVFAVPFNRAVIRGTVTSISPTVNPFGVFQGETLIFGAKDGDAGGPQSPTPVDDFFAPNTDAFPAISCKDLFYVGDFNNVVTGNVTIKVG